MPSYTVGYATHRDGDERRAAVLVERLPMWVAAIGHVTDLLCTVSRNRLCSYLCGPAADLVERHADRFEVPADPHLVAQFSEWRGWGKPFYVNDDGAHASFTRMP